MIYKAFINLKVVINCVNFEITKVICCMLVPIEIILKTLSNTLSL